ncbi:MAG TPA: hypothetical protein VFW71_07545 [Actinomycetota bacterium]|nr:hypothetical protein [Actinomycetota bacterium]
MLTDNGKVFTGPPWPAEVLFERICREKGIATIHGQDLQADHSGQGWSA